MKKSTEHWVCNGHFVSWRKSTGSAPLKKYLTEFNNAGKVIFSELTSIGHIAPVRYDLGMIGTEGIYYTRVCSAKILKVPKQRGYVAVIMVGEEHISFNDLNDLEKSTSSRPKLPREWSGFNRDTEILGLTIEKPTGGKNIIVCGDICAPEEIAPLYQNGCLVGIDVLGETTTLESFAWRGESYDSLCLRVVLFRYCDDLFGLMEIFEKDGMGRKTSRASIISKMGK